ncbi:poly-beta-1,6 N-acetyl-D-glucosamine export porin PgaA [Variovorax ginsengisoli]|uniref:Biofilm PGA synthesis protein PgaA n=1 Tax=Variovorax ginsengisoli TaxID=363844 RepID=A0ABT9S532_9BURK|nr:poly-beta-1,6 N-acetyl-D-glucosamine export porin PgaA [Variovorax ginsengisoli]MDP9898876.1 biofilm PGA synthesis protein PgaA [Variovorax ginsengisoli]
MQRPPGPPGILRHALTAAAIAASLAGAAHAQPAVVAINTQASESPYSPQAHDALVTAQRSGSVTPRAGFAQLEAWRRQSLDAAAQRRVASDGVVWAMAAGQPADAARWAREAPLEVLDAYAFEPAFQAARSVADRTLEGEAVRLMRTRQPQAWRPRIFEAVWQTDQQDYAQAEATLASLRASWPSPTTEQQVALLEARGALNEARARPLDALADYNALLAIEPHHRYARRAVAFILQSTGAESAALAHAQAAEAAQPGTFSALEMATLRQQAFGQQLRWAVAHRDESTGWGAERFALLDALLPHYEPERQAAMAQESEARSAGDVPGATAWRNLGLQLRYDRIVALTARARYAEATASYEALAAEGVEPPYYVQSDVAGAYQQQRRSDLAVPLYEAALRRGADRLPMPSDTHIGLVYAYMDTARFDEAQALLSRMEEGTPPMLRLSPQGGTPNPQYTEVRNLRALMQLYADRPAQAERSAGILSALAPMNAGLRSAQAETAMARSHPQAALAHYDELLTDHPDNVSVRAGHAGALFNAGELSEGRRATDALAADAPDAIAVRNAVRLRDATLAPRLEIDAEAGRDGGALANREWRTDTRLISPWFGDDTWRLFYHQILAHADTDQGNVTLARAGIGAEYLKGRWNFTGELHQSNDGPYRTGVALGLRYRASDQWRLSAEVDTNSPDTPWKARNAGIGAHATALGATYVVNESRSFDATAQRMDFSDGNTRDAFGLDWRERWISGPRFQFETTLGGETARYDRQDTPYFSPARESAVELGARARYLTWKRDDRSFAQVVEASTGRYRQEGFGSGPTWSLRYAHEWSFGPTMQLRYGLGVSSHPYDGVRERRPFVFLNLSVPLQ